MTRIAALPLDARTYRRHPLHGDDRVWVEKNCYIDIWIEVIHALGLDPAAILPFTLAIDFVDDQWTFFKPPHGELHELYGVDVQELTVWRPLVDHAVTHLAAGRLISTEADAYWLPDTHGTDYRTQHTKTTIVIAAIDVAARWLGYFHNASYFELAGEDFAQLFRLDAPADPGFLPLYAELVRFDRKVARPTAELATRARALLAAHLARRPADNPVERFAARLRGELPELTLRGLPHYHAWAFATIRQLGAAFELAAYHLRWLAAARPADAAPAELAAAAFDRVSATSKALILKAARAVNARRALDPQPLLELAADWDRGMTALAGLGPA